MHKENASVQEIVDLYESDEYSNKCFYLDPKDGKMNLVVLCEECHERLHHGGMKIEGFIQTSKGKKIK